MSPPLSGSGIGSVNRDGTASAPRNGSDAPELLNRVMTGGAGASGVPGADEHGNPQDAPGPRRGSRRARWNTPWSDEIAKAAMVVMDFATIIVAGLVSWVFFAQTEALGLKAYMSATATSAIAIVTAMAILHMYQLPPHRQLLRILERLLVATALSFGFLTLASESIEAQIRHAMPWKLGFYGLTIMFLLAQRATSPAIFRLLGQRRLMTRNIVVIGAGEHGERLLESLQAEATPWTRIIGFFDDRAKSSNGRLPRDISNYPVLGTTADLVSFSRRFRVDEIFIALPWTAEKRIQQLAEQIRVIPADVHLSPELGAGIRLPRQLRMINGMPMINFATKPISGWSYLGKWLLDKSFALVALILLSPLLLLVAAAIKLDSPGPVFFHQKRLGFRNRQFSVYKFRSMYTDKCDPTGANMATRNDPRVSRVGAFIRKTSIDELPQLLNVLKGDMSLVGPRPHALNAKAAGTLYQEVVSEYALRHRIKPGITGWAQMKGWRGETDTEEKIVKRVEHDLYYIENWSLLLDIYIIVGTAVTALFHKSAY